MNNSAKCIYCLSSGPFADEHALPAGFGEFEGFPLLVDRVCGACNGDFSQLEEQLLRSGPEALLRTVHRVPGRSFHRKRNPFQEGSAGAPPIEIEEMHPKLGIPVLWEIDPGGKTVTPLRQVVAVDVGGNAKPLRVPRTMRTSAELQVAIARLGLGTLREVHYFAGPDEVFVADLVRGLGGSCVASPPLDSGMLDKVSARIVVTNRYFRAVAKCGFHYLLAAVPNVHGSEAGFSRVRQYIKEGLDGLAVVTQERKPLVVGKLGNDLHSMATIRPQATGHILTAEWHDGRVIARIQYFLGPTLDPPVFRIPLAESGTPLHGNGGVGHFFAYHDQKRGRFAGCAESLDLIPAQPSGAPETREEES